MNKEQLTRKELRDFEMYYDIYQPQDFSLRSFAITDALADQNKKIQVCGEEYTIGNLNRAIENTGIKLLEEEIQKAQILSSGDNKKYNKDKQEEKTVTNFSIEYNPYLVNCIFKKNGKVLNEKVKLVQKQIKDFRFYSGNQLTGRDFLMKLLVPVMMMKLKFSLREEKLISKICNIQLICTKGQ